MQNSTIEERIKGVVERITFHNESNGWSVLKVSLFSQYHQLVTVTVHQTKVFAGATMEFTGKWVHHPRYGKQFHARQASELIPANSAALEKYLGSGLIKGVGPKTAKKIVGHFGKTTLEIFENNIDQLKMVPGIAEKKLETIKDAWTEHREIREVMMFLQSFGISTLFAVRIYKQYGDAAISMVRSNPYRLASDFYGIGFITADKIALQLGFDLNSDIRIKAAISHILSSSRDSGDCYLTSLQIIQRVNSLLDFDAGKNIPALLAYMEQDGLLRLRKLTIKQELVDCYYAKPIFYDEEYVARRIARGVKPRGENKRKITERIENFSKRSGFDLSSEQKTAVREIVNQHCSILTGGPGCGKTTTTKLIVSLLQTLNISVMLAAPTGRAAQRMSEIIMLPAKTIHRLLEFQGSGFKKNEDNQLQTDFLIVDECSMLDISLAASLLRAVSKHTSLLFIGDADQLPSVGAGNVLKDLIESETVPCYQLKTIFRQAQQSEIIAAAHRINKGKTPLLESPFKKPEIWNLKDCFFIDSEEATRKQIAFANKVRSLYSNTNEREQIFNCSPYEDATEECERERNKTPDEFKHVVLPELATADTSADLLLAMAKKTHPWSSLYYGLTALDVVRKLYNEWIPKYMGRGTEI